MSNEIHKPQPVKVVVEMFRPGLGMQCVTPPSILLDFGSAFLKKYCDLFNLSIRLLRTSAFNDLVAVTASVFLIISNNLVQLFRYTGHYLTNADSRRGTLHFCLLRICVPRRSRNGAA